jgi:hypothetical protein
MLLHLRLCRHHRFHHLHSHLRSTPSSDMHGPPYRTVSSRVRGCTLASTATNHECTTWRTEHQWRRRQSFFSWGEGQPTLGLKADRRAREGEPLVRLGHRWQSWGADVRSPSSICAGLDLWRKRAFGGEERIYGDMVVDRQR